MAIVAVFAIFAEERIIVSSYIVGALAVMGLGLGKMSVGAKRQDDDSGQ